MSHTVFWVKNDLRLHDNLALDEAIENSQSLDIVFEYSPSLLRANRYRREFLDRTLLEFSSSLAGKGQRLHVVKDLAEFLEISSPESLVFSSVYNSQDAKRIRHLEQKTSLLDITFRPIDQTCLYTRYQLPIDIKELKSFTPYRKKVESTVTPMECIDPPQSLPNPRTPLTKSNIFLKTDSSIDLPPAGESSALQRLNYYLWESSLIETYKETRNGMVQYDDSSKISPYLALGSLSPRKAYWDIKKYENEVTKNESTYWLYFELLWRDYFKLYSLKHGDLLFQRSGPKQRELDWLQGSELRQKFRGWKDGSTGQDFIDANMRELLTTGWMSNRGRQNAASYWAKHLCGDWRLGAKWFEKCLIDFDIESNWGNWAYNSGVGSDPRDRKFNPVQQSQMYDPDHSYRDKFLK